MWVIATLVMAAVNGFQPGVQRLTWQELEAFYGEMRRFGTYFGLATDVGPQTWTEFQAYYAGMLNQPWMGSTPVSKEMAWAVAAPTRPAWLRLLSGPLRFTFSEMIPDPVCGRLGFRRTMWSRFCMRLTTFLMPRVVWLLPARLRFRAVYVRAQKRVVVT